MFKKFEEIRKKLDEMDKCFNEIQSTLKETQEIERNSAINNFKKETLQ